MLKNPYDGARVPASLHIMNWAGNAKRALIAGHIGKAALKADRKRLRVGCRTTTALQSAGQAGTFCNSLITAGVTRT